LGPENKKEGFSPEASIYVEQTAGDVAFSMNHGEVYQIIMDEGVRAEMLRSIMEADDEPEEDAPQALSSASDNATFLKSKLRFETTDGHERCLDAEGNVVMAGWESNIMRETAQKLCEGLEGDEEGISVLNVGFGLGIVSFFTTVPFPDRLNVWDFFTD
jgi:protein arginine N-methyltransferase 2